MRPSSELPKGPSIAVRRIEKSVWIMKQLRTAVVVIALLDVIQTLAAETSSASKFGPKWSSLIGEWQGENQSGVPSGACGFHFDLREHVIVRTNHAELSAAGPAHDDLMVMAPDSNPDRAKATYYDNEGHQIEYIAEWSADGNSLVFNSKPSPGPQFRLTYKKLTSASFSVTFEMASPGIPANFRPYASGKITRLAK
jgi:hypothetical protein